MIDYSSLYLSFAVLICFSMLGIQKLCYKKNQILPSTFHYLSWGATFFLMILELKNYIGKSTPDYSVVGEYMLYLMLSSIIGFALAWCTRYSRFKIQKTPDINTIGTMLHKYRFILYLCLICGVIQSIVVIRTGGFASFAEYRVIALSIKKNAFLELLTRVIGHITILGSFYIMLLGYYQGRYGINAKKLCFNLFMLSSTNIAIGGRLWLITALSSFVVPFIWSSYLNNSEKNKYFINKDKKKIFAIIFSFAALFSVLGILRHSHETSLNPFNKFLYMTDGAKVTNMVMSKHPEGSYKLSYGTALLLGRSHMIDRFKKENESNVGLLVTVQSTLVPLYYDFGYWGGIIVWGGVCFLIEFLALKLRSSSYIISLLFFLQLSIFFIQAPIFSIFTYNSPYFQWLFLIFVISKIANERKTNKAL